MRFIVFVLFAFISFIANARVLHVGDDTIKLSQAKTTSPALHIKVDGEMWYSGMYNMFLRDTLHVLYQNTNYSVSRCKPFIDSTNYTYDNNGKLIAANKNLYLQRLANKQMFIDTNISGNNDNLSFEVKYKFNVLPKINEYVGVFGNYNSAPMQGEQNNQTRFILYNDSVYININSKADNSPEYTFKHLEDTVYVVRIGKQEKTVYGKQLKQINGLISNGEENTSNIVFFDSTNIHRDSSNRESVLSIYSFKIWENDVLIRDFVPVPCGLLIGNYVVPENGMWDIVEQKFYGNAAGYDDFIYSYDNPAEFDLKNYKFDTNNHLISVNEDVYLTSGNNVAKSNYINTGISGENDNLSFEIKYKNILEAPNNTYWGLFGNYNNSESENTTRLLFYNNQILPYVNNKAATGHYFHETRILNKPYIEWFDKNNYISNGINKILHNNIQQGITNESDISLFSANTHNRPSQNAVWGGLFAIYYFKIWDNDVLVRHFVPVPQGLQIGDFVVPSNGMWDIVEQKFYGNMGTGDFIYGVDE